MGVPANQFADNSQFETQPVQSMYQTPLAEGAPQNGMGGFYPSWDNNAAAPAPEPEPQATGPGTGIKEDG